MKLGSILKDPEDVESSLNLDCIEEIPSNSQRDVSLAVRGCVETELRKNNSLLVKATPSIPVFTCVTAGASVEGHWKYDVNTTVKAMGVRATSFIPSKEYMDKALQNDEVKKYVKSGLFGKPLYIIVGVATAKKLSVKEKQSKENKMAVSANFNVPPAGEYETSISHENTASIESELEVGEECDFAYRVREFFYSKVFGLSDRGNRTKKALLGAGRKHTSDYDREEIPQFEWFEEEDVSRPGFVTLSVSDQED